MRRGLLAVAVAFFSSACPPPCDRSTCSGCCEPGGECLPGTSRNFCGRGGVVCGTCPSTQRCQAGSCVDVPDGGVVDAGRPMPGNCSTGCLSASGECQAGNLPEACGIDAGVCVMCAPMTERCEAGRCVAAGCSGCLDAVGACRSGFEALSCGRDGGLCVACSPGLQCRVGVCSGQVCNSTTCATGCCRNDVCTPPSRTACGLGGAACVTCPTTASCVSGLCR